MDIVEIIRRFLKLLFKIDEIPKPVQIPLTPQDEGVKNKFDAIRKEQYDEKNNNCMNKSDEFAKYIISRNAENVDKIIIGHDSGKYGHEFIIWNEFAYDPTVENMIYGVNLQRYLDSLIPLGFTGMRIRMKWVAG